MALMHAWKQPLKDPTETERLGAWLGASAVVGDCLLLSGPLGAGKTALAQGIGRGLGVQAPITSPTFSLLNDYQGRLKFFHLDLYRLSAPEIASLGLAETWEEPKGVSAIEWPERLEGNLIPEDALKLTFQLPPEGGRIAHFEAKGPHAVRWLDEVMALAARA